MPQWPTDERHRKKFGKYEMVPERTNDGTAYLVTLTDGEKIRVKSDVRTSAQKRSRVVSEALKTLRGLAYARQDEEDDSVFDPELYLVGALAREGLEWEYVTDELRDVPIEEWLAHWFEENRADEGGEPLREPSRWLLQDLDTDGWEIRRKEDA